MLPPPPRVSAPVPGSSADFGDESIRGDLATSPGSAPSARLDLRRFPQKLRHTRAPPAQHMAWPEMAPTEAVETLIFVDVDGVLNVGIHDEGKAPLLLRDEDVQTAIKLAKRGYKGPEAECRGWN
ncbi:Uncharacterized protein SCF082_LOCUS4530 [Durusdinium trenchii]|uniref:Uncharacterized protein n=1 Tax=Durusdinium trenchii TaxID=1381693 RepID=A0ABP0I3G7_9DINO